MPCTSGVMYQNTSWESIQRMAPCMCGTGLLLSLSSESKPYFQQLMSTTPAGIALPKELLCISLQGLLLRLTRIAQTTIEAGSHNYDLGTSAEMRCLMMDLSQTCAR